MGIYRRIHLYRAWFGIEPVGLYDELPNEPFRPDEHGCCFNDHLSVCHGGHPVCFKSFSEEKKSNITAQ
jgi:hypothetical protein